MGWPERERAVTYELLPHTADLRVAVRAPSLRELYTEVVKMMSELFVGDSSVVVSEEFVLAPDERAFPHSAGCD